MEIINENSSSSPESIDLNFLDVNNDRLSPLLPFNNGRPLAFLSSPNNSPTFHIPYNSIHGSDEESHSSKQSPEIIDLCHSPLLSNSPADEICLSDSRFSIENSFNSFSFPNDKICPFVEKIDLEQNEKTKSFILKEEKSYKQDVNFNYLSSDDIEKISSQLKINNAIVKSLVDLQNEGFDDLYIRSYGVVNKVKATYEEVCKILDYINELKIARERIDKLKQILSFEDWIDFKPLFMQCTNIFDVQKVLIGLPRDNPDYELIFEGLKVPCESQSFSKNSFLRSPFTSSENLIKLKKISEMLLQGELVFSTDFMIGEDQVWNEIKKNIILSIMKSAKFALEGSQVEMQIELNEEALKNFKRHNMHINSIHSKTTETYESNKNAVNSLAQEQTAPNTSQNIVDETNILKTSNIETSFELMSNYQFSKENCRDTHPESNCKIIGNQKCENAPKNKANCLFFEDRCGSCDSHLSEKNAYYSSLSPIRLHLKNKSHGSAFYNQYRKIFCRSFFKKINKKRENFYFFKNIPFSSSKYIKENAHSKFKFSHSCFNQKYITYSLVPKQISYQNFARKNSISNKASNKKKRFAFVSNKALCKSNESDLNSKLNKEIILMLANNNSNQFRGHNLLYPIIKKTNIKNERTMSENKAQFDNTYCDQCSELLFRNLCTPLPILYPPPLHIVPPLLYGESLGILSIYLLLKDEMKAHYITYISNLYNKAPPNILSECVIKAWNNIEKGLYDYIRWEMKEKAFREIRVVWIDWLKNVVRGKHDNYDCEVYNLSRVIESSKMKIWLLPLRRKIQNIGVDGGFTVIGIWISKHGREEGYIIGNFSLKICVISPWGKVLEKNGVIKCENLDDIYSVNHKIKTSKNAMFKENKRVIHSDWDSIFKELNRLLNKYECDVIGLAGDRSHLFEIKLKNAKAKGFFNKNVKWIRFTNVGLGSGLSECIEKIVEKSYHQSHTISQDNLLFFDSKLEINKFCDGVEVNVARRVQYPLRELISMNGKNIGGFKWLNILEDDLINKFYIDAMREIIDERGVDVNTANWQLLRHVPGVSGKLAFDIIQYRETNGVYMSKRDYKNIKSIKPLALTQCSIYLLIKPVTAGLLLKTSTSRYLISSYDKYNIWDSLMICPDDYATADNLCSYMSLTKSEVGTPEFRKRCKCMWENCNEQELAAFCSSSIFTLRYLVKQLIKFNENLIS